MAGQTKNIFKLIEEESPIDTRPSRKIIWHMGDSMSKVREKRSTSKSGFFFNEMWKIIGQIDDIDRFFDNSCNLGVF